MSTLTRALVVGPYPSSPRAGGGPARSPEARFEEACGLARAIDLDIVAAERIALNVIRPATYLGKGKL